jgi:hypothetical protein
MKKSINNMAKGIGLITVVLVSLLSIGVLFGFGDYIAGNDARSSYRTDDVTPTPPPIMVPTVAQTTVLDPEPETKPVDILLADIIKNDVANKSYYNKIGGSKDVHICGNMACEQAEWIADNYGYETGVVLLWNSGQDASHAQTWVMIDDDRYIFESTTYNAYWNESDHKDQFGGSNQIRFVPLKKGREHAKAASEWYRSG